jgi:hypothetical protein
MQAPPFHVSLSSIRIKNLAAPVMAGLLTGSQGL